MNRFKKVRPGEKVHIPADTYNAFIDAAIYVQKLQNGLNATSGNDLPNTTIVLVRNDSGEDVDKFGVLGIEEPLILPEDSEREFSQRVLLSGVTPTDATHKGRFVILLEPLRAAIEENEEEEIPARPGAIGRAVVAGAISARVDVQNADDNAADVNDGETGSLKSGTAGAAQILWKAGDSGVQWAVVRMGGTNLSQTIIDDLVGGAGCDPFDCIYPGFNLSPFEGCPCGANVYQLLMQSIQCGGATLPANPRVVFNPGASTAEEGVWESVEIISDSRTFIWRKTATGTTAIIDLIETTGTDQTLGRWICDDWCCFCRRSFRADCPPYLPVHCEGFPATICAQPYATTACPSCTGQVAPFEFVLNAGTGYTGGVPGPICGCEDCCESFEGDHRLRYSLVSAAFDEAGDTTCPSWKDDGDVTQTGTPRSCVWVSRFINLLSESYIGLWTHVKHSDKWFVRAYLLPIPVDGGGSGVSLGWGQEGVNPDGYTEDQFACLPGVYRSVSGTVVNPCVPVLIAQFTREDCDPVGEYERDEVSGATGLPEEVSEWCETLPETVTIEEVTDQGDCTGTEGAACRGCAYQVVEGEWVRIEGEDIVEGEGTLLWNVCDGDCTCSPPGTDPEVAGEGTIAPGSCDEI